MDYEVKKNEESGYYNLPLHDFPFSGDFILLNSSTKEVCFDSRKDGYNAPNIIIEWVSLIKDENAEEGAVFCFSFTKMSDFNF